MLPGDLPEHVFGPGRAGIEGKRAFECESRSRNVPGLDQGETEPGLCARRLWVQTQNFVVLFSGVAESAREIVSLRKVVTRNSILWGLCDDALQFRGFFTAEDGFSHPWARPKPERPGYEERANEQKCRASAQTR